MQNTLYKNTLCPALHEIDEFSVFMGVEKAFNKNDLEETKVKVEEDDSSVGTDNEKVRDVFNV